MKNIVVPVDFTDLSFDAFTLATGIAKGTGAKLTALHVVTLSGDMFLDKNGEPDANCGVDVEAFKKEKQQKLNELQGWLKQHGFEAQPLVVYGHVVSELRKLTEAGQADMIVMGTHPMHGLQEKLSVSLGEQVVKKMNVPVITLKCNRPEYQVKSMTFAHNFVNDSKNLETVKVLQKAFNSQLNLLQVHKPGKDTEAMLIQMKEFAKRHALENVSFNLVEDKNLEDGIIRFNLENNCDLLAIETQKKNVWKQLFGGDLVEDLVHHIMMPVLTFNN